MDESWKLKAKREYEGPLSSMAEGWAVVGYTQAINDFQDRALEEIFNYLNSPSGQGTDAYDIGYRDGMNSAMEIIKQLKAK